MIAKARKEMDGQSLRLESHEAELNRLDTAFVEAAKTGTRAPGQQAIFSALGDGSMLCAEMVEFYRGEVIPKDVGTGLLRLHCAITNLAASLKMYSALTSASTGLPAAS